MNEELKKRIEALENWKSQLESSHSIPLAVDQAFRERFTAALTASQLSVSSKGVDTEDITINESGSGTKVVLNDPVGFLQITINATDYYIPYYNA